MNRLSMPVQRRAEPSALLSRVSAATSDLGAWGQWRMPLVVQEVGPLAANDMHDLYALFCLVAGGGIAWTGYRLSARSEYPPEASRFAGPILSRHLLIGVAGNLLVVVGLIIGVVFSLIFLLT